MTLSPSRPVLIGVISDTHAGDRLFSIPPRLTEIFANCDFILHAGDVGEWWALDALSAIRPVIAVHGNDDSPQSHSHLPFQQIIKVGPHTLYLSHSHNPDKTIEFANRVDDAWGPKLDRIAGQAAAFGGDIFVYGHSHIPMNVVHNGVLLVNPGALASPNLMSRQTKRSVCLLRFEGAALPTVTHINADTGETYTPEIDWAAGFKAATQRYTVSLITPEAAPIWERIYRVMTGLIWANTSDSQRIFEAIRKSGNQMMRSVWEGQKAAITPDDLRDLIDLIRPLPEVPPEVIAQIEAAFEAAS